MYTYLKTTVKYCPVEYSGGGKRFPHNPPVPPASSWKTEKQANENIEGRPVRVNTGII